MKFKIITTILASVLTLGLLLSMAPFTEAAANAQTATCVDTYTVAAGDTLSKIAEKLLGDLKAYPQIADATNAAAKTDASFKAITDVNKIDVGQKLCIPAKSGSAATTPAANATPAANPTLAPSVPALTLAQLGTATYVVQDAPGGKVTLQGGKAAVALAPGSASQYTAQVAGPLANGMLDGKTYAAAVLITSGGGSGTFYNLAAVPNENGKPGTGMIILLGDRIKVQSIAFENNTIKVGYLDRKPGEAMSAEPSVAVTKFYTVNSAGALAETTPGASTSTITNQPGFPGTYLASSPAADASALLQTLVLNSDGGATLANNYVGKGVSVETGTWTQASETAADVTFTKQDDRNVNDKLTFELSGDTLSATQYDQGKYGSAGLQLNKATGVVTGTVSYTQKIALPDSAVVEVYLVDASKADAPYTFLSGASFTTGGKQVPLSFEIPYAASKITAGGNYQLYAFISADGRLLFKNNNGVKVLTGGAPTSNMSVVVDSATP